MKRIVILCDGTWNVATAPFPTHVAQLSELIPKQGSDGVAQVVRYLPGVGTGRGKTTPLGRWWDQALGGAFGVGLKRNVRDAYADLVRQYEIGDEVFIFGYSRGAYTARSLVGMIRSVGVMEPADLDKRLDRAMDFYRSRDLASHPRNPASYPKRLEFSPKVATSAREVAWRKREGHGAAHLFEVAYLGLWDTVGALGVPAHLGLLASIFNRSTLFYDTVLSTSVKAGRHAVSIDENRRSFEPTLWENLALLNKGSQTETSQYQEKWFPGDHSVMGGGGPDDDLSSFPFAWVVEGGRTLGLSLKEADFEARLAPANALGRLSARVNSANLVATLMRRAPRSGPVDVAQISDPAQARWCQTKADATPYNPKTLRLVSEDLDDGCVGLDG